jgi:hypothetical protein
MQLLFLGLALLPATPTAAQPVAGSVQAGRLDAGRQLGRPQLLKLEDRRGDGLLAGGARSGRRGARAAYAAML